MNPVPSVHLAIDGGATRSFGVAVAADGRVLASARAGSLNFFGTGLIETRRALEQLLGDLKPALAPGAEFANAVIGCAALFAEATPQEKKQLCAGLLPLDRTRVVSDSMTAHFGATLGQPGVVVIAGTGSIILAKSENGCFAQVGGWGHLLGDEGSAYWIAREAVRAALAASEGRGLGTALAEDICRWFKVKTLHDMVPIVHATTTTKERFAALAQFLCENTRTEDAVFSEVLRRAGRELAAQALAAIGSADLKSRPVPVYTVGSVIAKNALVRESFVAALQSTISIRLEAPQLPPVLGAAAMTLHDAGLALTSELIANLRSARPPQS